MSRPISAAYLERKLRAILGVQGDNPIPRLEDVAGLITLENDRPEWALAGNEVLWAIGRNSPAVAGQQSFVGVHVPALRGILSIVQRITVATPSLLTNFVVAMNVDTSQPGDGIVFIRDFRAAQLGCGTRRFEGASAAPNFGNVVRRAALPANGTVILEGPWILPPNSEIGVFNIALNQAIDVSFEGYERPLEGGFELK